MTTVSDRLDRAEIERLDAVLRRHLDDWRVWLFLHRAAQLQSGHPTVAAGLRDHSDFYADPLGRGRRTLAFGQELVFGDSDAAGRAIRDLHRDIQGTGFDGRTYHAWNREAWTFVHLTVAEAVQRGIDTFHGPLTDAEWEDVWAAQRLSGTRQGVPEGTQPPDVAALRQWFDRAVDERVHGNAVIPQLRAALRRPKRPRRCPRAVWRLAGPVYGALLAHATDVLNGTVPPEQRRRMGLPWSTRHAVEYTVLIAVLRALGHVLPHRLLSVSRPKVLPTPRDRSATQPLRPAGG
ncbi:MAG: oxygenase MpaB family protein [Jatrophihabitans sp.]|uniref:oxygenase MpaB family protein n=1 Tax=Jatrophihabitans sp. TaxID=1932789 RepID=UPI003F8169DC